MNLLSDDLLSEPVVQAAPSSNSIPDSSPGRPTEPERDNEQERRASSDSGCVLTEESHQEQKECSNGEAVVGESPDDAEEEEGVGAQEDGESGEHHAKKSAKRKKKHHKVAIRRIPHPPPVKQSVDPSGAAAAVEDEELASSVPAEECGVVSISPPSQEEESAAPSKEDSHHHHVSTRKKKKKKQVASTPAAADEPDVVVPIIQVNDLPPVNLASPSAPTDPIPAPEAKQGVAASPPSPQRSPPRGGIVSPKAPALRTPPSARIVERAKSITAPEDWFALRARDWTLRRNFDVVLAVIRDYNASSPSHRQIRIPVEFIDPLSKQLMVDPVRYIDGRAMDRRSVAALQYRLLAQLAWVERRSPEAGTLAFFDKGSTRAFFRHFVQVTIVPDRLRRMEMQEWLMRILGVFPEVHEEIDRRLDNIPPVSWQDFASTVPIELLSLETVQGSLWEPTSLQTRPPDDPGSANLQLLEFTELPSLHSPTAVGSNNSASAIFRDVWEFTLQFAAQTKKSTFAQFSRHSIMRSSAAREAAADNREDEDEGGGDASVFLGGRRNRHGRGGVVARAAQFWNVVEQKEAEARKRLVTAAQAAMSGFRGEFDVGIMRLLAAATRRKSSVFSRSLNTSLRSESPSTMNSSITRNPASFQPPSPAQETLDLSGAGLLNTSLTSPTNSSTRTRRVSLLEPKDAANDIPAIVVDSPFCPAGSSASVEEDNSITPVVTLPQPTLHSSAATTPTITTSAAAHVTSLEIPKAQKTTRSGSYIGQHDIFLPSDDLRLSDVIANHVASLSSNVLQRRFIEAVVDMWLDEDFDVKVRLYCDAANRRKARIAKFWLLNATSDESTANLLDVNEQFLRTSMAGASGKYRNGKEVLTATRCTVEVAGKGGPAVLEQQKRASVETPGSRPISSRHNKERPRVQHWTPPPLRTETQSNKPHQAASKTALPKVPLSGAGGAPSTIFLPTASSLSKATPRPPPEPRERPKHLDDHHTNQIGAQWRKKLPFFDKGGEAPRPEQQPWFVQSVKDVFQVINPAYLDVTSSEDESSGDDGCSSDDYDGLNTLMNFLKVTNSQPKGKQKEEEVQQQRLNIIHDLVTNGVRQFVKSKEESIAVERSSGSGQASLPPVEEKPRFPLELVRGNSATPRVEMDDAVIDVEFPTTYLLRELNNRFEQYDARAAAERQAWLTAHGFSSSFVPYEHPDERVRRLARRDAQVLAEVASSSLDHLKVMWEGFGTGHQCSRSMIRFRKGQRVNTSGSGRQAARIADSLVDDRRHHTSPVCPPRTALAANFEARRRLVPQSPK